MTGLRSPVTASNATMYATATRPDLTWENAGRISPESSPSSFLSQAWSPNMTGSATSYGSCFFTNPRS